MSQNNFEHPGQPLEDIGLSEENSESAKLQKDLLLAQEEAKKNLEIAKRALADYQNLVRETNKKNVEIIRFANLELLEKFLPIYDHLKMAEKHLSPELENNDWVRGVMQIKSQFDDLLKTLGVEEIKTVGEKFDPSMHEAIGYADNGDEKSETVVEEVAAGYKMGGRIIYPAKVMINK